MTALEQYGGKVNHIAIGEDFFLKYWDHRDTVRGEHERYYSLYHLEDLAFGFFLSSLQEFVWTQRKEQELPQVLKNSLYPIEKEECRTRKYIFNYFLYRSISDSTKEGRAFKL